jgi:AraC-like DNA-binding protein
MVVSPHREGGQAQYVARDCGFGTGATLRTHFRRSVGVSPTAYRNAFGRAQNRRNDLLEYEAGTKR